MRGELIAGECGRSAERLLDGPPYAVNLYPVVAHIFLGLPFEARAYFVGIDPVLATVEPKRACHRLSRRVRAGGTATCSRHSLMGKRETGADIAGGEAVRIARRSASGGHVCSPTH